MTFQTTNFVQFQVDKQDAPLVIPHRWHAIRGRRGEYRIMRSVSGGPPVVLAREILRTPSSLIADHKNGDGTDNRRRNLRNVTRAQNAQNRRKPSNNNTGYKGVHYCEGKYRAQVIANGRRYRKRGFTSALDAARWYNDMAQKHHKQYARLNRL